MGRYNNDATPFPAPVTVTLLASATATVAVNFDGNRIWRLEGLSSQSTGRYTLNIVDQGSGESIFQAAIRDDLICGPTTVATYPLRPYWFPSFYWITGPNGVRVIIADVSAAGNTVNLVLHGSYVPKEGYTGSSALWQAGR